MGFWDSFSSVVGDLGKGIGGVVGGIGTLITGSKANKNESKAISVQKEIAEANLAQQVKEWEYQKELNQLTMDREDSAVQRRVSDLKAAGLSPTLAAGSAAGATALKAGTAPQMDASFAQNMQTAAQNRFDRKMKAIENGIMIQSNLANISKTIADARKANAEANAVEKSTPYDVEMKRLAVELNSELNPIMIAEHKLRVDGLEADNLLKKLEAGLKNQEAIFKDLQIAGEAISNKLKEANLSVEQQKLSIMALEYLKAEMYVESSETAGMPLEYVPEKARYIEYIKQGVATMSDKERAEWNGIKDTVKNWFSEGIGKIKSGFKKVKSWYWTESPT